MPSQLIASFTPTVPANTPQASPVALAMNIPSRLVRKIRARIPAGPRGNMGFQIGAQGQQIIPETQGAFLVADNELFEWDLIDFPEGGSYQLIGYNLGQFPHTVYVTFELDPVSAPVPAPTQPLDATAISSAPTAVPTSPASTPPVAPVIPPPPHETPPAVPGVVVPPIVLPPPPTF